jgi:hypothetical protein
VPPLRLIKVRPLARYYAELDIGPPSRIEAKPQDFATQIRAVVDAGAPVLSFIYGIPPSEVLDECRKQKIKTIGTATTPEEASALEQAGFEFMVASSFEGGGHRWSFLRSPAESLMGGFALIPRVGRGHCQTSRDSGGRDRRWARPCGSIRARRRRCADRNRVPPLRRFWRQQSVPNCAFIVCSKRNGPYGRICGTLGERNQESADERIQTCEQSAAAISCATRSGPKRFPRPLPLRELWS